MGEDLHLFTGHTESMEILYLWYFVFVEDERDVSTTVVQVATIGLTLSVRGWGGVR